MAPDRGELEDQRREGETDRIVEEDRRQAAGGNDQRDEKRRRMVNTAAQPADQPRERASDLEGAPRSPSSRRAARSF